MSETEDREWPRVRLGAVTTKIGSGATPRGGKKSYKESGISLVRSLNVYDFRFSYDDLAFIDDEQAQRLSNVELLPHDILLNITGASIARCCMVPHSVLPARVNQHVSIVRVDPELASPKYVLYSLNNPQNKRQLHTLAQGGATRQALTQEMIQKYRLALPPISTQRKIAAVLSAYDDLIENNTRRIAILEEMAQLLYREWFVHFRFPGHEDAEFLESGSERANASVSPVRGPIPRAWTVKRLDEACHLTLGVSPKSKYYNQKGEGLPFHQGVSDFGRLHPITRRYCSKMKRTAQPGDILFSVRAPVGRLNIADRRIVIGRGLHAIRSKTGNQLFVFLQLSERFKEEDSVGSGTIFKSVTKSDMLGIELLMPPLELIEEFESIVEPMLSEMRNLTDRNNLLHQGRDLLLPRLVSGELKVADLPIEGGPLAA